MREADLNGQKGFWFGSCSEFRLPTWNSPRKSPSEPACFLGSAASGFCLSAAPLTLPGTRSRKAGIICVNLVSLRRDQ